VTQAALARELGITKQAVQKLARRGMPTSSPELARAWRARNTRSQVSPPRPPTPESIMDALDEEEGGGAQDADGIRDNLALLARLREAATERYESALSAGEDDNARKWGALLLALAQRGAETESKLRRLREQDGETLTFNEAREAFGKILMEIKTLLTSMPAAMAAQVNPADSLHAQRALEGWRDSVFRKLHGADSQSRQPK
jgi:transcriptional regulator with XRE-family HTH domain